MPKELDSCQYGKTSERHFGYNGTPLLSTATCLSVPLSLTVLLHISQGELETQKRQHEAKLITTKEEEKHKMDKMALELELKWTETLR